MANVAVNSLTLLTYCCQQSGLRCALGIGSTVRRSFVRTTWAKLEADPYWT